MTQEEEITLDINLKILGNSEIVPISLPNNITIESIKILASDYTDIPIEKMRLILTGRAMRSGTALKDYDVHNGSTIHIVPERERNPPPQTRPPSNTQQPTPPQPQQQNQNQPQQQAPQNVQPQQQINFPTPNNDLIELRTAVSNVQQRLSEISFAASSLQRAINQSSVGSSNEALNTLCQRFSDVFQEITHLNSNISSFHATNPNDNNNEIAFSRENSISQESNEFQNDFMYGFSSVFNHILSQGTNTIVLEPQSSQNSGSPTTASPSSNPNQNSSLTTITTTTTTTTSTTTSTTTNQAANVPTQTDSISRAFQGEIAPGVQASVDVQVVNVPDGAEDSNEDNIVEVDDIDIDIDNITTQINSNAASPEATETTDSQHPQPIPTPTEEVIDLSRIVLDPEELEIVNADAEALRQNFEPPVLSLDYFRQHSNSL